MNNMRRLLIILMTLLAINVQAQRQQISYVEETRNWYYVYDEAGKMPALTLLTRSFSPFPTYYNNQYSIEIVQKITEPNIFILFLWNIGYLFLYLHR